VDDKRHRFAALLRPESCAALAGLTERQRLRAADALDEATYESGECIVARGAPSADGVFVVTRGVAREETPFRASGADDISRAGREYSEYSARMSRGSDVSSARLLRRGDVFGTDGVFDGGTRERSVVAGGGSRRARLVRGVATGGARAARLPQARARGVPEKRVTRARRVGGTVRSLYTSK
jgi:CRP-like cAMP-binding protein